MRALILAVGLLCALSVDALDWDCKTKAYLAIAADTYSTRWAIQRGGVEENPIYGSDPDDTDLAGGFLARAVLIEVADRWAYDWANCAIASMTMGAAMQNMVFNQSKGKRIGALAFGITIWLW